MHKELVNLFLKSPFKSFQLRTLKLDPRKMAEFYTSRFSKTDWHKIVRNPDGAVGMTAISDFKKIFKKDFYILNHFVSESEKGYNALTDTILSSPLMPAFLISKIPADNRSAANALIQAGFYYVCLEAVFSASLKTLLPLPDHPHEGCIRPARTEDIPVLQNISRKSHTDIRYYYDPFFEKEKIAGYYASLISKSFKNPNHSVLVYESEGEPAGFITMIYNETLTKMNGKIYASLDYIAVDPQSQKKNIGYALNNAAIKQIHSKGDGFISVKTMGTNYPAMRLLFKNRFCITSQNLVFHRNTPQ